MINKNDENLYPHSPDVLERETLDDGFSKGWAMHVKPYPEYFFDCHVHYYGPYDDNISENLSHCMSRVEGINVKRALILLKLHGKKLLPYINKDNITDGFPSHSVEELEDRLAGFGDPFYWAVWLNHLSSEPHLVEAAAKMGARCIKLHNAPIIEENLPPDLWLNEEWTEVFKTIQKYKFPVLFHVTQRLSLSTYTGGGRNSYWTKGWQNGTSYTNEDLLQAFLECCRRYPDIPFLGAHQLHLGWDRLEQLFAEHLNLYVDATCGCQLKLHDNFYPHDKEYLRGVFIRNADRILFGTDTFWDGKGNGSSMENWAGNDETFKTHIRFIMQLDLPQDVLDKICCKNSERLFKIGQE